MGDRLTEDTPRRMRAERPRLRSLLSKPLAAVFGLGLALAALMLANTLYLLANRLADGLDWTFFALGELSLPVLFQVMVLLHTGLGLLLVTVLVGFVVAHLPVVWKRRHRESIVTGGATLALGVTLLVTGLFILTAAASRENRWAWWLHVAAAALVPAAFVAHRLVSYTRPAGRRFRQFAWAVGIGFLILVAAHALTKGDGRLAREAQAALADGGSKGPGSKARDVRLYLDAPFVPAGFVPPESPFFPSAATTSSGGYLPSRILTRGTVGVSPDSVAAEVDRRGFAVDALIGAESCVRCHQDIVWQWSASAHRFASFNNPFYEATINDLRAHATAPNPWVLRHLAAYPDLDSNVAFAKSKWCSGCHDPALMLAGKMNRPIDRRSVEAQAGLTCLACHAIDTIHNRTGNGNYNIADEQEDPYLFANARGGTLGAFLHDAALKAKPTVHKRQMLKPFFREAEFCATCHKVSLQEPVNNYRWLRGQDEFDNWDDSGVSLNASRTFYLPPKRRVCQDCHMPPEPATLGDVAAKNGMVRSHRFLAVNTALPYLRGDTATIRRIEAFLRDEKLSVDIFALSSRRTGQTVMAIDRRAPAVLPGDVVTVDVVVRNRGVGHTFPGGTNDSNEGWLEFTVLDGEGRVLAQSGFVGEDGHLDSMAHVYKALIVDRYGNPIHKRNAQDIYVTVFANVIGPGTADLAHYEFAVPPALAGRELTLRARLLWRKFDRFYTEFAYRANPEGFKQFAETPDLPITEIATAEVRVRVARSGMRVPARGAGGAAASDWMRYNDYGIGLLLEENTRQAAAAFGEVERLAPERIDGPLNLARVALQDGNLEAAYAALRRAEAIAPGDPRAAWVWGLALQEDGEYGRAVQAYRRVLEVFPGDRAAWRNLGRTYYLDGRYEDALAALDRVLAIDPEDRVAHYHRMLALRALGREAEAQAAALAYELYAIDESAQEITLAYRRRDPGANLMAQRIRTHQLVLRP